MLEKYISWARQVLSDLGFRQLMEEEPWQVDILILFIGVGVLGSLLTGLWRFGLWFYRRRQQIRLSKDLHPFFSTADIKQATEFYVPTHFQSTPPSQHPELNHAHNVTARQKLLPFFLNRAFKPENDQQRFYIVLAGSGMGKTTFMLNLYLAYLRRKQLGKAPFHIRLMPLGYPDLLKRIDGIKEQEKTILLLDGLDEDTQAIRNYKRRLERILNKVKDFRFVVFTCRTQFFPTHEEEPRETGVVRFGTKGGYQVFAKLYLSPFDRRDIQQYLRRRFGRWKKNHKSKALRIVERSPNLIVRPMLLGYIEDLLASDQGQYQYLSKLYETLIEKWIEREANRVEEERREQFAAELYRFSREVAINIYKQRRHRKGLFIGLKEIKKLGEQHQIRLDEIEMQSRSLLNRDVMDRYKFAHKSILEYFLAREAVENPRFSAQFSFQGMDQARMFFQEMCLIRRTLPYLSDNNSKIELRFAGQAEWQPSYLLEAEQIGLISALKAHGLEDLSIVSPLVQLEILDLRESKAQALGPITGLNNLYELLLSGASLTDLSGLEELPQLERLDLAQTGVHNLEPLRKLGELRELDLQKTPIRHFEALNGLSQLRKLSLAQTSIKDLTPLRNLSHLTDLNLKGTKINGINPLKDLKDLRSLNLSNTPVKNINIIRNLPQLEWLDLSQTPVSNFNAVKALPHLTWLRISAPSLEAPLLQELSEAIPNCEISVSTEDATFSS